jgi:hypothetical protein
VTARPFIEAEQAGQRNVARACELLEVSRSAFYQWRKHVPSARELGDADLATRITGIHAESKGTYGIPRVHAQLRHGGVRCGRKRVARIHAPAGLGRSLPTAVAENDHRRSQR